MIGIVTDESSIIESTTVHNSPLSLSLDRTIEHVHGPSDTWEALQWAAEALVLTYVIGLMRIAMAHTITRAQSPMLVSMGASLFVLIGAFGVGRHRLRALGSSECIICYYFMAWNAQE